MDRDDAIDWHLIAREQFADRLGSYWKAASVAMSQGGNHTIRVDPTFMEDIRSCEWIVRRLDDLRRASPASPPYAPATPTEEG